MTIHEALEEAFEQCGIEALSGHDIRTARRSLSLCLKRWVNRGLNFWQAEEYSLNLIAGTRSYAMASNTTDLILASIQQGSNAELNISPPVSLSEYHAIPNKTKLGRPVNYLVHREMNNPVLYLWPVPDSSDYVLKGYRLRSDGVGDTNDQSLEVPSRFEPALIADLAAELALKKIADPGRRSEMMMRAKELWLEAERGDASRASLRFVPEVNW